MQQELRDDPDDPRHGTPNGYINGKCRCDRCLPVGRAYHRKATREAHDRRAGIPVPDEVHGSWDGYSNWDCRCRYCKSAAVLERLKWKRSRAAREARVEVTVDPGNSEAWTST